VEEPQSGNWVVCGRGAVIELSGADGGWIEVGQGWSLKTTRSKVKMLNLGSRWGRASTGITRLLSHGRQSEKGNSLSLSLRKGDESTMLSGNITVEKGLKGGEERRGGSRLNRRSRGAGGSL
jgi:hypothetical protein